MTMPGTAPAAAEPAPEGATWVVRDADGRVTQYGTEPIRLEMTTQLGEQIAEEG